MKFAAFALLLAALVAHPLAQSQQALAPAPAEPIKFGMSGPMSGPSGSYGKAMRVGIQTYFTRVNQAGGVAGRRLQLVAMDDGYEVNAAVANARKLITEERVFGLIGFYGSASTTAVLPVLTEFGVPLVGTVSGAMNLRKPVHPYIFHLRASYDDETEAIVKHLTTIGVSRIAVFYQDDAFGMAGLNGVKDAAARRALSIVEAGAVPRNSLEVGPAVEKIAASKPQAVVLSTLYRPTAEFIKGLRARGVNPHFIALSPVGTEQLAGELGHEQARGVQVVQVVPSPSQEKFEIVRQFRRDMAQTDPGEPLSYYALEGYMAARLAVLALQRSGAEPSRKSFITALRTNSFELGGFPVRFSEVSNQGTNYVELSVVGPRGKILN